MAERFHYYCEAQRRYDFPFHQRACAPTLTLLPDIFQANLVEYVEKQIIQISTDTNLKQRIEEDIRKKQQKARENVETTFREGFLLNLFSSSVKEEKRNRFGIFVATNSSLRKAAILWNEDRPRCIAEYGHPCTWDTCKVTDISGWFEAGNIVQPLPSTWNITGPHFRATNATLPVAVNLWIKYKSGALLKYGKIQWWDTSQVTDMSNLFNGHKQFNAPIGRWNVSQVTNMTHMFYDASSFNQSLSNWNVSQVTNMSGMFVKASSFNQSLSDWDVSQVTYM